jgi:hypothetical protein
MVGSDVEVVYEAEIDFGLPFVVDVIKQKNELVGACNSKKEIVRKLKHCVVTDPYTRNSNCFFQCLKKLGL